ncbi:SRPBCC family protein [Pseudonocardia sp. MH-G8]|uniref:SRPBCC family protein n=1 Tax=Pseudonocardia sp. MH-G8 TaxID=1854588 RepID=UPI000BA06F61|nr:SRPBCC family protein [Pseudonocardia sp. MH-G8]OZM79088.1 polyketide cyclase [Pseudonocardia sp. MH-G8]
MFEIDPQISAVRRQVGTAERDGKEAKVVTISQAYDTDVDDLWEACTTPDRLARWFAPVSGDLRLGGRYRIEGNAEGTVQRCDPPKSFSLTWEFGGGTSWVEVQLSPEPDGGSRFELAHTAYPEEHWEQYGPGAVGLGYDIALAALALHLRTAAATNDQQHEAWWSSDEGKRFLAVAGERWYEADVAGGTPPETARGAADRTIAAYTA